MAEIDRVELVRAIVAKGSSIEAPDAALLLERIDALAAELAWTLGKMPAPAASHATNEQATARAEMSRTVRQRHHRRGGLR